MGERLVQCDTSHLVRVPVPRGEALAVLQGVSASQIKFGSNMRAKKMPEWSPDLPDIVYEGLRTITDSTWWIANQNADTSEIKWPVSWLAPTDPLAKAPPAQGQTLAEVFANEERRNPAATQLNQKLNDESNRLVTQSEQRAMASLTNVTEFDAFARKVANSPDQAYLTILALAYRATKDDRLLNLYDAASQRINGTLHAINVIAGEP